MPILNGNLEWSQFDRNPEIRNAFNGVPAKTLLPSGAMLCRFITTETAKKEYVDSGIYSSPWWTEWGTTAKMLGRWQTATVKPIDVIRARLAVTGKFSAKLDSLVQIILTQPVYAWKGSARHQEDDDLKLTYLGGGEQLFLPNLVSDKKSLSCSVAYLHCFTSIDSLV